MNNPPHIQAYGPAISRIGDLMAHTNRYAFKGATRLARDAHVSASSVSRLMNGKTNPSFLVVARITCALEHQLKLKVDPRDLISESGKFQTKYLCELVGCQGCLPENAHDEFGDIKPSFVGVKPGRWETSRYPKGFHHLKGGK